MREWKDNGTNSVMYINETDYISKSHVVDELALRVCSDPDDSIDEYTTYIIENGEMDSITDDMTVMDIYDKFLRETNGSWSNDIEDLAKYVTQQKINTEGM